MIHKSTMPLIIGFDFAGVVASIGKSVTAFKEGDEVFGRSVGRTGSYAEYTSVPHTQLWKKPS